MGFLSGILGTSNNFTPAASTSLVDPVTGKQVAGDQAQVQGQLNQQQSLVNQLAAQGGLQNQSNVYSQLQGVANGTGPNPAQAQLAQATGANVANQAALMAGQRGSGANAGLLAREAAQQGAATQQQAAGQGATLQANQSLNAINSMGGIANQQASNLLGQANTTSGAVQGLYGTDLNQLQNQNSMNLNQQQGLNNVNAGVAAANQQAAGQIVGGLAGAGGTLLGLGSSGAVKKASGGIIESGPSSFVGKHFASLKMSQGGKVPVILSPGEKVIPRENASAVAQMNANALKIGKTVPGKAKVKGDSLENDNFPTSLNEGDIVIPRSALSGKDPHKSAAEFVAKVLAKKGLR